MKGSSTPGKLGKYYPAYHCARNHSRISDSKKDFEKHVEDLLEEIKFSSAFVKLFKAVVLEVWEKKQESLKTLRKAQIERISKYDEEIDMLVNKLKVLSSPTVIETMESEIETLEFEKAQAMDLRNSSEVGEYEVKELLNYAGYIMEHPYKLIEKTDDVEEKCQLFSLFFEGLPNYEEIKCGTPALSPVFKLSKYQDASKDSLVTPRGIEPRLPG